MRFSNVGFAFILAASLTLTPAYAGQRGHAAPVPATHPQTHSATPPPHPASKPNGDAHKTPPANTGVAQRISSQPQLASRLQPLLPAGTTLADAASGFKNQGQFIAALHVSHNLNIPFAQIKTEMTGKDHDSLGRAIQDLRPGVDAKAETRRAESEANEDLRTTRVAKTPHKDSGTKAKSKDRDDG